PRDRPRTPASPWWWRWPGPGTTNVDECASHILPCGWSRLAAGNPVGAPASPSPAHRVHRRRMNTFSLAVNTAVSAPEAAAESTEVSSDRRYVSHAARFPPGAAALA